ncbi:hypothetical protein [Cohnella faecalis]|uniref:hypothetical protein n=1 Tax=Cohnella faecalis TaxID=2315694 RepID=UPI0018F439E2|nr:hypothetical protein [Cohnella faecalis]
MTPRPAQIKEVIRIPLLVPRARTATLSSNIVRKYWRRCSSFREIEACRSTSYRRREHRNEVEA